MERQTVTGNTNLHLGTEHQIQKIKMLPDKKSHGLIYEHCGIASRKSIKKSYTPPEPNCVVSHPPLKGIIKNQEVSK